MNLVLIDTSVWINLLRNPSDPKQLNKLQAFLERGEAAWCEMIYLELWSGIRDAKSRKELRNLSELVKNLNVNRAVWEESLQLAALARGKGVTTPTTDVLIFACAKVHSVKLWHCDKHFDLLAKL